MLLGVITDMTFLLFGQRTRLLQFFPDVREDHTRSDSKVILQ